MLRARPYFFLFLPERQGGNSTALRADGFSKGGDHPSKAAGGGISNRTHSQGQRLLVLRVPYHFPRNATHSEKISKKEREKNGKKWMWGVRCEGNVAGADLFPSLVVGLSVSLFFGRGVTV